MLSMKTSIIEHYWGIELETSIGSRKYLVKIKNDQPIEIMVKDSSKKQNTIKTTSAYCSSNMFYPCKPTTFIPLPITPKPIWSITWDNLPIANCFYSVINAPQIKRLKKSSVKRYFENIIFKLNKLGAFL